jgi:hypothetical protein
VKWRAAAAVLAVWATWTAALPAQGAAPAGVTVHFPEGSVHAFLELHTEAGQFLAPGDLTQLPHNGAIESRMTFHFTDSSLFEETVIFAQHGVFALQSYHLVQQGPAYTADLDALLSADGAYHVVSTSHKGGKSKTYDGTLKMPSDVSNGLPIILLKNLGAHDSQTVHLVAFTPAPRMIQLRLSPVGPRTISNHARGETAAEFDLKPVVGGLAGFFGKLLGKIPPDSHVWLVTQGAPMFVRFQGPLYTGPLWRIDLALPQIGR